MVQENQPAEWNCQWWFFARVYFLNHKIAHKRWMFLIFRPMKRDVFLFGKSYHALFESQYSWNTNRKSKDACPNSPNFRTLSLTLSENLSTDNWRTLQFIGRSIAALKAQDFSFNWQQRAEKSDVHMKIYSHPAGNFPLYFSFLITNLPNYVTFISLNKNKFSKYCLIEN